MRAATSASAARSHPPFSQLAGRFGVDVDPWPGMLPDEHAWLPEPAGTEAKADAPKAAAPRGRGKGLALVRYRSLFSGAAVERVARLEFQRPAAEVELSPGDASKRGIAGGETVTVSSNGTSKTLRARVNRRLRDGVLRIASEHAEGLEDRVEVKAG